jgi:hypothetical protein
MVYVAGTRPATPSPDARVSPPYVVEKVMTVRVIGPIVSCVGFAGSMPKRLTRGSVGRSPTRLLTAAGPRIDPPVSSPIPTRPKFAATAEAEPPDDPLGLRRGSYALRIMPAAEPT